MGLTSSKEIAYGLANLKQIAAVGGVVDIEAHVHIDAGNGIPIFDNRNLAVYVKNGKSGNSPPDRNIPAHAR